MLNGIIVERVVSCPYIAKWKFSPWDKPIVIEKIQHVNENPKFHQPLGTLRFTTCTFHLPIFSLYTANTSKWTFVYCKQRGVSCFQSSQRNRNRFTTFDTYCGVKTVETSLLRLNSAVNFPAYDAFLRFVCQESRSCAFLRVRAELEPQKFFSSS